MIKLGLIQSKKENIFGTNSSAYKKNTRRAKCCLTSNKGIFKQNKIVTPQRGGTVTHDPNLGDRSGHGRGHSLSEGL